MNIEVDWQAREKLENPTRSVMSFGQAEQLVVMNPYRSDESGGLHRWIFVIFTRPYDAENAFDHVMLEFWLFVAVSVIVGFKIHMFLCCFCRIDIGVEDRRIHLHHYVVHDVDM